jgi:two-component system, sensor histidine kinase and response regulator
MSNPAQIDQDKQKSEYKKLITKMRLLFFQAPNQQVQQTIVNSLLLVGDFLQLNRICVISSITESPIFWNSSNAQENPSWFNGLMEKSIKHPFEDDSIADSMTDSLIYLNLEHPLISGTEQSTTYTFSIVNLFSMKNHQGFLLIENCKPNYVYKQEEKELLKVLASLISEMLIEDKWHKEVSKWKEKAESANHIKDQFLSNINHEIQTPLGGIHNAMYLLGSTELDNEQKEFLQIAQSSLERLSSVVEDVLNISKLESGQVEIFSASFDLEEELIRILRMQKSAAAEKRLELNFKFDYTIRHEVVGDIKKVRQILMNLISNAIKYTEKGTVSLSAEIVTVSPLVILFSIGDTGLGIDEQESKKIYEQFYQSDATLSKKQQGIGLGLSITNNLVRLLKGKLDMQSQLNQGSTFTVQLPFETGEVLSYPLMDRLSALFTSEYAEDQESFLMIKSMGIQSYTIHQVLETKFDLIVFDGWIHDSDQVEKLKKLYGKDHVLILHFQKGENQKLDTMDCSFKIPISRKNIYQRIQKALTDKKVEKEITSEYSPTLTGYALIVDDNRLNRIALGSILKKMGMKSKSVGSGIQAIDTVTNESFDVILMDLQMPEMDGLEATRRIRHLGKKYLNLPIIAVTANTYIKDYDLMKTAQINDVIFKPIQFDQLNQMLRKYIKQENEIHIPDELFVFDSYDFKMRFEGSDDIADEVIKSFLSEYTGDLERINTAVKSQDSVKIIETTHYFKGSCSYLSGKRAVWLLGFMIEQSKANDLSQMEHCLDMLNIEIKTLVESIETYKRKTSS